MITIGDLLQSDERWREIPARPEMDPLSEDDALQEAQLLDVRFDTLSSTLGLLFELRMALQLREASTGVLIVWGAQELSWMADPRSSSRTAWTVLDSRPGFRDPLFSLRLDFSPAARLSLTGRSAAFFVGAVPDLDRIPDYVSDDEPTVRANLANWQSKFSPTSAVFMDPAPAA